MTEDTLIIAGPSGGTSTFLGGLLRYVDKQDEVTLVDSIMGEQEEYRRAIDRLFTARQYPEARRGGYVVRAELQGASFARPGASVFVVQPPGDLGWARHDGARGRSLLARVRSGVAPEPDAVRERYENDIRPDFDRGVSPGTPDDWETVLLHHYYTADRVVFLLNLHAFLERPDRDIAYDVDDLKHATDRFVEVAVVPTAVDLVDYDPDGAGDEWGLLERIAERLFSSGIRDEALLGRLVEVLTVGTGGQTLNVLNYVDTDETVEFFGVAVPDEGSPQERMGRPASDGEGGFEVQGFEQVVEWLER